MNLNHTLKNKLTCKEVINQVCEHLGELPDSPLCVAIQEHLRECENCNNFYDQLEKTVKLFKQYSTEFPNGAHERLLSFLGLKDREAWGHNS